MAELKFRIYLEEDESVYRDIAIRHTQSFKDLCMTILQSFDFDNKHQATFYRSNDNWQRGRAISLQAYEDVTYTVAPLLMEETRVAEEVKYTNQRFIFIYDFIKNWTFLVELINVSKEESSKLTYPAVVRKEGIGPQQYGTRGMLGPKFQEMEEKYDLASREGFGVEGDDGDGGGGSDDDDDSNELIADEGDDE